MAKTTSSRVKVTGNDKPKLQAVGQKEKTVGVKTLTKGNVSKNETNKQVTENKTQWLKNEKNTSLQGKFDSITGKLPNIVRVARAGVATDVFYSFASTVDMPDKFLADLINTTTKTLSNYKEQNKKLEPVKAEHLLKLISLFKKGEEILGNLTELKNWLIKPKWNATQKYVDLLNTPGGVDLVDLELDRLAEGYSL